MEKLKNISYKRAFKTLSIVSLFLVLVLTFLITSMSNALADERGDGITKVNSKTYGELGAKWWQWAFSTDWAQFEDGDVDCSAGQKGKVWFLAGSVTGAPTVRTCLDSIPKGKTLFFPLLNYGFWLPDDNCPDGCTVEERRELARGIFSDEIEGSYACQLSAIVDGVHVQTLGIPIVHTQSPVFSLEGTTYGGDPVSDPEVIDDGYYVAIPPLGEGDHTIEIKGGVCPTYHTPDEINDGIADPFFLNDVIYNLSVSGEDDEQ